MLAQKKILLVITGGIAAYKTLELIRLIRKGGGAVRCILTRGGAEFVTSLSVSALSGEKVYTDLWSLTDEAEMGHIRLSRECDLVVVAPASADFLAKMTHGLADDLASTCLLASDKPVLIAPAMNPEMWANPATQANIATLRSRGIKLVGPENGDMACGETGLGRMSEPQDILEAIHAALGKKKLLAGLKAIVTAGATHEPIDPVRFIGNRSSGKQGYAIACALRDLGASVTLVAGATALPDPSGMKIIRAETGLEMMKACDKSLPVDIAICAAAVADWRPENIAAQKIKKDKTRNAPEIRLIENPDILKFLGMHKKARPKLVVGFAAETENLRQNAAKKLKHKGCDWIVANSVAMGKNGSNLAFGRDDNAVSFITSKGGEDWPRMGKAEIAERLALKIADYFKRGRK